MTFHHGSQHIAGAYTTGGGVGRSCFVVVVVVLPSDDFSTVVVVVVPYGTIAQPARKAETKRTTNWVLIGTSIRFNLYIIYPIGLFCQARQICRVLVLLYANGFTF